jgi:hypothetical protein
LKLSDDAASERLLAAAPPVVECQSQEKPDGDVAADDQGVRHPAGGQPLVGDVARKKLAGALPSDARIA